MNRREFSVELNLNIGSLSFMSDDDSDSDQEEQEKKRKRRRRSSDRQTVMKEKWLKKHPLSIQLKVNCAGTKLDESLRKISAFLNFLVSCLNSTVYSCFSEVLHFN